MEAIDFLRNKHKVKPNQTIVEARGCCNYKWEHIVNIMEEYLDFKTNNMTKYKLNKIKDNQYEIIEPNKLIEGQSPDGWDDYYQDTTVFQGTFSECSEWLTLHEKGYID